MVILYSLTLFLSACLLFFIQPMVAKMIVPLMGGSSSVWNTSMVFFQFLLLFGYLYAHLSLRFLGARRQAILHLIVLSLPLFTLPIALNTDLIDAMPDGNPTLWLLGLLFAIAGLPYFAVSTNSPIFQRWFSLTDHKDAQDPYFLYAASNVGSMGGLLLYPFLIERIATLEQQSFIWHAGYISFVILTALCAAIMWIKSQRHIDAITENAANLKAQALASTNDTLERLRDLTWKRRAHWILLAFIPSSLMLGFTTYITTDIASVPLLWVLPLAIYLLSFILVFATRPIYAPWWVGRSMGLIAILLAIAFLLEVTQPSWLILALHSLFYCAAVMVAHSELAKDRPAPRDLTEFFFWVSVGGALGGTFNALLAPLIFTELFEYVLVIALATMVRPTRPGESDGKTLNKATIAALATVLTTIAAVTVLQNTLHLPQGYTLLSLLGFAVPALIVFSQVEKPTYFAVALSLMAITGVHAMRFHQAPIFHERNFYGTVRVATDDTFINLMDGNTVHGRQFLDDTSCQPLSYYHPQGPAGYTFQRYSELTPADQPANIALLGTGIGSLTCYGRPSQHWDLYEINPLMVEVASNPDYFQILSMADLGSHEFIGGDGRIALSNKPQHHYDILVVDAFSSGSIPVHLLTRESVQLYLSRLSPDGYLLIHISNRLLNLAPIVANIAASLDTPGLLFQDYDPDNRAKGKEGSLWVVLSPSPDAIDALLSPGHSAIRPLQGDPDARPWTDHYSDIVSPLFDR